MAVPAGDAVDRRGGRGLQVRRPAPGRTEVDASRQTADRAQRHPCRAVPRTQRCRTCPTRRQPRTAVDDAAGRFRSEEHTSELQSLMRISYAVFCLTKKNKYTTN